MRHKKVNILVLRMTFAYWPWSSNFILLSHLQIFIIFLVNCYILIPRFFLSFLPYDVESVQNHESDSCAFWYRLWRFCSKNKNRNDAIILFFLGKYLYYKRNIAKFVVYGSKIVEIDTLLAVQCRTKSKICFLAAILSFF